MNNLITLAVLFLWLVVGFPVGFKAYRASTEPRTQKILLSIWKSLVWPPYLLGRFLVNYLKAFLDYLPR